MAVIINHDLRVVNGGTLYMPPWEAGNDKWGNLELPIVNSRTTIQKYPTGTIYRLGMRTFVYTQLDDTYFGEYALGQAIGAGYLMESSSTFTDVSNAVVGGIAGEYTFKLTKSSTAVNAWAGGFVGIKGSGDADARGTMGKYGSYQIISNTVQDGSNIVTFTLDTPLPIDLTITDDVVLTQHPYAVVRHPTDGPFGMTVGALMCTTAASKFVWLQTGGPHNMIHPVGTFEGDSSYSIPFLSHGGIGNRVIDGSTQQVDGIEAGSMQCIGYSYPSSKPAGAAGSQAIAVVAEAIWLTILN